MSFCVNPRCLQPDHPANDGSQFCRSCGSDLVLLGRYRVMRLLSDKSGFGRVYEAFDRSTPKILKVLKENYSQHSKAVELFRQEAIVLGQLPHPGIPAIEPQSYFEFYPKDSPEPLYCIVMEKIEGPNLKEWMHQQGNHSISESQAWQWLQQLVEILHLVHSKHYFHRDIKPENIMLRSNGQLVLVDFGAAREMTYTYLAQMGNTGSTTRLSSAGYTPPEQERGQAVPQSDFYALGYTFIYLLTGKQPTDGGVYNPMHNELQWRKLAPHISPALADFIDRLISPRVVDRPKNTDEILLMLAQIKQQKNIAPLPPLSPTLLQTQPPVEFAPQPKLPKRWLWGGGLALLLAVGGYATWQMAPPHLLQVAHTQKATLLRSLEGHTGTVRSLAFTPDSQRLISAGDDQTLKIWSAETGQQLMELPGHTSAVKSLAVKSDGSILASASDDQTITLWNLNSGESLRSLKGHTSYLNEVAISPDGRFLISSSADQSVRLWNLATGEEIRIFTGHMSYVNAVVFSPDGQLIATASADQTIRLWNVDTGEALHTLRGHSSYVNAVVFSPDGQQIISASADQTIKIWDVASGQEINTLKGHRGFVEDIAISADGQRLFSGGADQTIKVWDLSTSKVLYTLTGFDTHIKQFAVSPDGQMIAVSAGKTIKIARLPR